MNKFLQCIILSIVLSSCLSKKGKQQLENNKKQFEYQMEIKESSINCWHSEVAFYCSAITSKGFPIKYYCSRIQCTINND